MCLSTATTSWRVGVETADAVNHADYIMEQITMGLRSAYYPDSAKISPDYGMIVTSEGEDENSRDTLTWVKLGTALVGSDSEVANTPHKVSLSVVGKDESNDESLAPGGLVLRAWRMSALPEDFDPEDEEYVKPLLLMPGILGIHFRVRDPKDNLEEGKLPGFDEDTELKIDDEEKWVGEDKWKDDYTNRLPYAVETTLYIEPPDRHEEPIEIKRVIIIPSAPLSWRDKGAAGGTVETGADSKDRNDRRNGRNGPGDNNRDSRNGNNGRDNGFNGGGFNRNNGGGRNRDNGFGGGGRNRDNGGRFGGNRRNGNGPNP